MLTTPEIFVLESPRRQKFFHFIRQTYLLSQDELKKIITSKEKYTTLMRSAALRNFACSHPELVGLTYTQKRKASKLFL